MGQRALTGRHRLRLTRSRHAGCPRCPGVDHTAHGKRLRVHSLDPGRCAQCHEGRLRTHMTEHPAQCKRWKQVGSHGLEGRLRDRLHRPSHQRHAERRCPSGYVPADVQLEHEIVYTDRAADHRGPDKSLVGREEAGLHTTQFALGKGHRDRPGPEMFGWTRRTGDCLSGEAQRRPGRGRRRACWSEGQHELGPRRVGFHGVLVWRIAEEKNSRTPRSGTATCPADCRGTVPWSVA